MKKILTAIALSALILTASCAKDDGILTASELLPFDTATEFLTFEPVMTVEDIRRKSSVRYSSDPAGQDPVIVEVYSYNGARTIEEVHNEFLSKKTLRTSATDFPVEGGEGYIAYPSLNIYRDGYMIVITAGSGNTDAQAELLKRISVPVLENLDKHLKKHPTDNDLLSEENQNKQ